MLIQHRGILGGVEISCGNTSPDRPISEEYRVCFIRILLHRIYLLVISNVY